MKLAVKITPKAKQNSVKKISDIEYHIRTTAPPDKGKANTAVLKLLAQELNIPKSHLTITHGHTSRNKIFETI